MMLKFTTGHWMAPYACRIHSVYVFNLFFSPLKKRCLKKKYLEGGEQNLCCCVPEQNQ